MGIKHNTLDEAFDYARERAKRLGSVQRIVEVDGAYRVGGEKKMDFFWPEALGWYVHPIY